MNQKAKIKKMLKDEEKWRFYKNFLGKKFSFLFLDLNKLFDLQLSVNEIFVLEKNLIFGIENQDTWIKLISSCFRNKEDFSPQILSNLSIFLYKSWKNYKLKYANQEIEYDRRANFNQFTLLLMEIDSNFNDIIVKLLKKWK
ncbi:HYPOTHETICAL PROTEIN MCJ_002830 [Mesomycoplasma conjunctivae]|uniref:Uncharacterized protein n=1 Tax=Mesomycoplasma conjunctivae (strain ATCC 25834 / NCTC 10147 / HRC/581) TaxID=572263 RepID=C5J682_MESCH|nr:hypothetical protein [Mesomycoplasma conjunctivae]CAT04974.1 HYPOTHETICAL PROTEIN MCJ_002830 [Mesomycoplasma conjunctivae]